MINPNEIFCALRADQAFAIESCLGPARAAEGVAPMTFYNRFSRFKFSMRGKTGKWTEGNVPMNDIHDVLNRSHFAYNEQLKWEIKQAMMSDTISAEAAKANGQSSPGFTHRIGMGTFKGSTPAAVLMRDPSRYAESKAALLNQVDFLKKNLDRYPRNQTEIDAIMDAIKCVESMSANKAAGNPPVQAQAPAPAPAQQMAPTIPIYKPGPRPLQRKRRADGMCLNYEIDVVWHIGEKYPLEVKIGTFYAPIKVFSNGMLNVMFAQADQSTKIVNSMRLNTNEWMNAVEAIKRNLEAFNNVYSHEIYNDAYKASYQYAKEQKAKQGNPA